MRKYYKVVWKSKNETDSELTNISTSCTSKAEALKFLESYLNTCIPNVCDYFDFALIECTENIVARYVPRTNGSWKEE